MAGRRRRCAGLALAPGIAALLAACGTPGKKPVRPEFDLHDPSATRRMEAVVAVSGHRDLSHVPALIALLDDEDAAVRMAAGATLKDLTGHDTGYRPYADPAERRRQIDLWRAWWSERSATGGVRAVVR